MGRFAFGLFVLGAPAAAFLQSFTHSSRRRGRVLRGCRPPRSSGGQSPSAPSRRERPPLYNTRPRPASIPAPNGLHYGPAPLPFQPRSVPPPSAPLPALRVPSPQAASAGALAVGGKPSPQAASAAAGLPFQRGGAFVSSVGGFHSSGSGSGLQMAIANCKHN